MSENSTSLDEYVGIGLYIQSPVLDLVGAQKRFDDFKVEYKAMLDKLTEEKFVAIKQGVLVGLTEAPKNMYQEVGPLLGDWYDENWKYDSKQQLIEQVKLVTLADIKDFYQQTLGHTDAARVNIQLRGTNTKDKPFATLKGQTKVSNVAQLSSKIKYQL